MFPVFPVEAARDELVATLKSIIISRLGLTEVGGEWYRFLALSLSSLFPFFFPSLFTYSLPFPSHWLIVNILAIR